MMTGTQGLSYAWRSLRRAPLFAATVVLTLTIGIGSAVAIFTLVNAVLLRPLPYGNPDRLVGVWHDIPTISLNHIPQTVGTYLTYKRLARTIEGIALYDDGSASVTDPDGRAAPERMLASWATADFFPVLGVPPILGRAFTAAEDVPKGPDVVVISEGVWRSRFGGDRSVIGKKLVVSGRPVEIIGVMPASFRIPDGGTQLWFPKQIDPNEQFPGGFGHHGVARLKPGVSVEAAERDFANALPHIVEISPNFAPGLTTQQMITQAKPTPRLIPMRDSLVGDISGTLWMVAATAALMLLVTCANVANLLLVRADGRHRELSVRAALGAGRTRVLAHFFTESALLAAVSSLLGIGAAAIAIQILVTRGPAEIPRLAEVHVDGAVIAFTIVVGTLVALACSAIPAIRFMRGDPLSGLRDGGRSGTAGREKHRARSVLVSAQMAFALVVLAASGLLLRSFQRLHAVRPGFNANGVATVWLALPSLRYPGDSSIVQFYTRLSQRVAQIPGVESVGLTSRLPFESHGLDQEPMWFDGDPTATAKIPPIEVFSTVDAGYFRTLGIPLIAGRTFDAIERQRGDEVIVSLETAIHFFHDSTGRAAIGKRFRTLPGLPLHTVIGVVGSTRDTSLSAPPVRVTYFPESVPTDTSRMDSQLARTMAVVARTNGDIASVTRSIQVLIRELDPTLPTFDEQSMSATVSASIARVSFAMGVLGVAAGVTLILGVIGLYGVIAYVVTLRTRELGVRIALGAQPRSVAAMVTKQGLMLSAAGIVVGLALVIVSARFLRSFLFEIAPTDPVTLAAATGTLVAFALLASWIPARRAARVNPIDALRLD
jgi:putative ABC transport system permease protein